ncbi:uncharacterized protein LODBEIA_P37570 [Lodderomyces beijingensis]|uniref:DNA mismatch repair protein PMS1 n=1 Tax=Lodderomyces beijingensis TaxID=1775926 RepID=A0ABP0ZN35_9ASCO
MSIHGIDAADISKISSGQVIIDLRSIVKELVENSIDALSTKISINFVNYGVDSITVQDNGKGIEREDFEGLCLRNHTSKLTEFEDLTELDTLGFRGEALNSICALADNVTVTTRTKDASPIIYTLRFDKLGRLVDQSKKRVGMSNPSGTIVSIDSLFKQFPVRYKNFIKNSKREFHKAVSFITNYVLIHPAIKFELSNTNNGKKNTLLSSRGGESNSVIDNLISIYGTTNNTNLLQIELEINKDVQITGHISSYSFGLGRSTQDRQFLYVNKRPVVFKKLVKMINEVYKLFNHVQYPVFILDLKINPNCIDVNVLPDKTSVLIHDEDRILELIREQMVDFYQTKDEVVIPRNFHNQGQLSQTTLEDTMMNFPSSSASAGGGGGGGGWQAGKLSQSTLDLISSKNDYDGNRPSARSRLMLSSFQMEDESSRNIEHEIDGESHDPEEQKIVSQSKTNLSEVDNDKDEEEEEEEEKEEEDVADEHVKENGSLTYDAIDQPQQGGGFIDISSAGEAEFVEETKESSPGGPSSDQLFVPEEADQTSVPLGEEQKQELEQIQENSPVELDSCRGYEKEMTLTDSQQTVSSDDSPNIKKRTLDELISPARKSVRNSSIISSYLYTKPPSPNSSPVEDQHGKNFFPAPQVEDDSIRLSIGDQDFEVSYSQKVKQSGGELYKLQKRQSSEVLHALITDLPQHGSRSGSQSQSLKINNNLDDQEIYSIKKSDFLAMKLIGQFNLGFILVIHGSNLFIIDQHASDEKYNFERILQEFKVAHQPLITPVTVEVNVIDEMLVLDHIAIFQQNGFRLTIDSDKPPGSRIALTSFPVYHNIMFTVDDFYELINLINDQPGNKGIKCSKIRKIVAMKACRSSVMIGSSLTRNKMNELVFHLSTLDKPWNCPHGRPTMRHLVESNNWQSRYPDYEL